MAGDHCAMTGIALIFLFFWIQLHRFAGFYDSGRVPDAMRKKNQELLD